MPIADGIDGRDMQIIHERPAIPVGHGDEQPGFHHGDKVGVSNDIRFAAGCDDSERLEGVAVQQFSNGFDAHAPILAWAGTRTQRVTLALDDLDRRVIEAIAAGELIRLSSAGLGVSTAAPGVPQGWTAESWRLRRSALAGRHQ